MATDRQSAVDVFRLLGDRTRLLALLLLAEAPETLQALASRVGASQPACSHQMALLRLSGLVERTREGKFNRYRVTDRGRRAVEAARVLMGST